MTDWRHRARCRTADPELFFPDQTARSQIAEAKAVCKPCPVRVQCLNWAVNAHVAGIWGGKDETEIRALRRKRQTA